MTIEAVKRYNEHIAKYQHQSRNEIGRALGISYATLVKYDEKGLIKLPPKMSKRDAGLKRKAGFGKFVIHPKRKAA